ncbi:MAG: IS200/IS605 family accessory protein TnpB-related protein [Bacteroidaceae bacterium]|nr:IS200/IS605 family accessory protein TnpB-related protein [Bacteroidaceae bacterium]
MFHYGIQSLTFKRNQRVNDYLHKSSRYLINQLVSNNINTIIIGKNKEWKQEINIGKRNNQNFVQIPHARFFEMLRYKAQIKGINVILQEESYTSKCSFLSDEAYRSAKVSMPLSMSSS